MLQDTETPADSATSALSSAMERAGIKDTKGRMEALFERLVDERIYEPERVKVAVVAALEEDPALFDEIVEPWYSNQRFRRLLADARERRGVKDEIGDGKGSFAESIKTGAITNGKGEEASTTPQLANEDAPPLPKPTKRTAAVMSDAGRMTADYPLLDHWLVGGKPLGDLTREECLSAGRRLKARGQALLRIGSRVPPGARVRDHVAEDEAKLAFRNEQRNVNVNG